VVILNCDNRANHYRIDLSLGIMFRGHRSKERRYMGVPARNHNRKEGSEETPYHQLISAVIKAGMEYTTNWTIQCVERVKQDGKEGKPKYKLKKVAIRQYDLSHPMFAAPDWIMTPCGDWWTALGGLSRQYLYQRAGGTGHYTGKCTPQDHMFI